MTKPTASEDTPQPNDPDDPDGTADTRTDIAPVPPLDPAATSTDGPGRLHLDYAALSDVGRVRKDNQDSGYAGPWVLTVCDGVGGAARGDIASSTAVQQLRKLDSDPEDGELLGLVAGGIHRAHDRISELVEDDPTLNGTSTTVSLALFDGHQIAIGHIGDSRAYLYRAETLTQLTKDHTFVQSLIDEGRITEEDSRTHPHRNLILKALDGIHDAEPDLFVVELAPGDRLFLCSDGACGSLTDDEMAAILAEGTPDYAVVEIIRAALEAGSSDNVTCVVADVLTKTPEEDREPMLVGSAADLPRRNRGGVTSRLRGHRPGDLGDGRGTGDTGDTGELDATPAGVGYAIRNDPIDPEVARYAPRPPRRFLWVRRIALLTVLVGIAWIAVAAAYSWSQRQYYVAEQDGVVVIFRGVDASIVGLDLSSAHETTDLSLDSLSTYDADQVREGIDVDSLQDARTTINNLARTGASADDQSDPSTEPSSSVSREPAQPPSSGESDGASQGGTDDVQQGEDTGGVGGVGGAPLSPSSPGSG